MGQNIRRLSSVFRPIGNAIPDVCVPFHPAGTVFALIGSRHRRNLAAGFWMQAYSNLARLPHWLSGMLVGSSLSSLERRPPAGTPPPTIRRITNRASRPAYAARVVRLILRPASAWAARLAQIRCNACRFSSTYSSVFWFVIERPLRSFGRSMPNSTA